MAAASEGDGPPPVPQLPIAAEPAEPAEPAPSNGGSACISRLPADLLACQDRITLRLSGWSAKIVKCPGRYIHCLHVRTCARVYREARPDVSFQVPGQLLRYMAARAVERSVARVWQGLHRARQGAMRAHHGVECMQLG